MTTTCKICQQPKTRLPNGTSPNKTRKYYVDENGDSWMGKKCPDCYRDSNRERMRNNRKSKETMKNVNADFGDVLKKLED